MVGRYYFPFLTSMPSCKTMQYNSKILSIGHTKCKPGSCISDDQSLQEPADEPTSSTGHTWASDSFHEQGLHFIQTHFAIHVDLVWIFFPALLEPELNLDPAKLEQSLSDPGETDKWAESSDSDGSEVLSCELTTDSDVASRSSSSRSSSVIKTRDTSASDTDSSSISENEEDLLEKSPTPAQVQVHGLQPSPRRPVEDVVFVDESASPSSGLPKSDPGSEDSRSNSGKIVDSLPLDSRTSLHSPEGPNTEKGLPCPNTEKALCGTNTEKGLCGPNTENSLPERSIPWAATARPSTDCLGSCGSHTGR